jgi:enoyl-CoA hydratase
MEAMGMRTAIRAGTDLQALGFHQRSSRQYMAKLAQGVTTALSERDGPFGDYRSAEETGGAS